MNNWQEEFDKQFPNGLESFQKAYWKEYNDGTGERQGIPAKIIDETENVKQFIEELLKKELP